MALRPRRSSLVTTRTSPGSSLSASLVNSGRWLMATLPEMVSVTMRCGSTRKPEAVIFCTWFSVVCSGVETLRYAKVRAIALPVRNGLKPICGQGSRGVSLTALWTGRERRCAAEMHTDLCGEQSPSFSARLTAIRDTLRSRAICALGIISANSFLIVSASTCCARPFPLQLTEVKSDQN